MKLTRIILGASALTLAWLAERAYSQASISVPIIYQGRLTDGGLPANGLYDMIFGLYEATSGYPGVPDVPVEPATNWNVSVSNGLFTTRIDFRSEAFAPTGTAVPVPGFLLELAVRRSGSRQPFTTLSPRQLITPAPAAYAAGVATVARSLDSGSNQPVLLSLNGSPVLRVVPNPPLGTPSLILGYSGNQLPPIVNGGTISGGGATGAVNQVTADFGTVGGGAGNVAGPTPAVLPLSVALIPAGNCQSPSGVAAWVGGGFANVASGDFAAVSGGERNIGRGSWSFTGGGQLNTNAGCYATIAGGLRNTNTSTAYGASVGGGGSNSCSATFATVAGGTLNRGSALGATVGGGRQNVSSANFATVGGGSQNVSSGGGAVVSGGNFNLSSDSFSTVGGGTQNTNQGYSDFIGGGQMNRSEGSWAVIAGGEGNVNTGNSSTIGGGYHNTNSGFYATIPGGRQNWAATNYTFAAGNRAKATNIGAFVWGDASSADIASTSNNQFIVRATGGLWFGNSSSPSIPAGRFINTTTGGYLSTGGVWTDSSDRAAKENFTPVDTRAVLDKVLALPIAKWNYKVQDESVQHIGPVAQDFQAAFGVGEDDRHIAPLDANGVALSAIQALHSLVKERDAQINALEKRLAAIEEAGRKEAKVDKDQGNHDQP